MQGAKPGPAPDALADWWLLMSRAAFHTYEVMTHLDQDYQVPIIMFYINQLVPGNHSPKLGEQFLFSVPDFEILEQYPKDSLGYAFSQRGQSPKAIDREMEESWRPTFRRLPELRAMIEYMAKKFNLDYETAEDQFMKRRKSERLLHDLEHLLSDYDMSWQDEIYLQAFLYNQTQRGSHMLITVGGTLRGLMVEGLPFAEKVVEGFDRGQHSALLIAQNWDELWPLPLEEVRRRLEIKPRRAGVMS